MYPLCTVLLERENRRGRCGSLLLCLVKFSQAIKRICNFTCPVRTSKAGSLFAVLLLCTDTPDTVVVVVLILPSIPATVVVVVVILIFIFFKTE